MNLALNNIRDAKWTVFGIVTFALFLDYFLYGLIVPLGPYSPAKITSESQLGILYAAYGLGVLLATPMFGHLGDKLGCSVPCSLQLLSTQLQFYYFAMAVTFMLQF